MKKFFTILAVIGLVFGMAPNLFANEAKDIQGIYEECGLGGLLFPSWPLGASVSNFTWDLGTTAATSGLTTPGACAGGKAKLAAYIYESYDSIEKDLAKGEGRYLDSLILLSEKSTVEKDQFISYLRNELRKMVEQDSYSSLTRLEKSKMVFSIIENHV
ncbi:DUF3015 family protein [Patescibacteria group bacterium]|nr:DUF3015 family protein [Patescibacteria group bacterium]